MVTVSKAKGLKDIRNKGSNAMVIVTAVAPGKVKSAKVRHQFQINTTCYSNEEGGMKDATWLDQPLMLPGVSSKLVLYFTAVDWAPDGGKLTFMG
jgi:hypothetical protein